jgi:nucleotide-binding universal stress UspA family protein
MPTTVLHGPVLVGTDLTPGAEEAIRQGAQLARDLDTPLIACHILPEILRIGMLFPQWRGPSRELEQAMTGKARGAVTRQLESVLGGDASRVRIVLDSGTPHVGVLAQADATGAGLIVTGVGQVAEDVARHASVPVLVARKSTHGAVVGATDFSDASRPVLHAAASEAKRRQSALHLIHAFDMGIYALGSLFGAAARDLADSSAFGLEGLDELRAAADVRLRETLQQLAVEGQTRVISGHAVNAIVSYAESVGAELVVVGTHGRSGFARLTLGSTASGVIDSAPCSVLVMRVAGN